MNNCNCNGLLALIFGFIIGANSCNNRFICDNDGFGGNMQCGNNCDGFGGFGNNCGSLIILLILLACCCGFGGNNMQNNGCNCNCNC